MDKYLKRKKINVGGSKPTASETPPREDMHLSAKKGKQEELEVTGVSRSGRVRKKSSKLTDFESPDEIDPRYKRKCDRVPQVRTSSPDLSGSISETLTPVVAKGRKTPASTPVQKKSVAPPLSSPPPPSPPSSSPLLTTEEGTSRSMGEELSEDEVDEEEEEDEGEFVIKMEGSSESDSESGMMYPHPEEHEENSSDEFPDEDAMANSNDDEDDDEGQLVMDEGPKKSRPSAMSLYMLEKSTKKKLIVKDGKIVGRMKAQRKDKGKSRFTAYMLWAKEARKDILKTNPELDFATTSKRLGELWGIVPNSEKYSWRRRAKRMSCKVKASQEATVTTESKHAAGNNSTQSRKFINKTPPASKTNSSPSKTQQQTPRQQIDRRMAQGQLGTLAAAAAVAQQQQQQQMQLLQQQQQQSALASTEAKGSSPGSKTEKGDGLFKIVSSTPVDVASHLKLLGESLLIIGERLKEHEGQIAVSGSFSVLLDSLLCSMGPLLCLTQQVPQLNGCSPETLSRILDNIAYIMPGL